MNAVVENPNEDVALIQDLSSWAPNTVPNPNNETNVNNNSTLLYIAVEYVKDFKLENQPPAIQCSRDNFVDFTTPHVSPLDPNMSSVARYSPIQYQDTEYNHPIVIQENIHLDNDQQYINTDSGLECMPTVLCNSDIREVNSQYIQMVEENSGVGQSDNLHLVHENGHQEVELLITDQTTGISYSVNAQELLVERCLEDEQHLLETINSHLDTDLLTLDDSTLKSELNEELIHGGSTAVDVQTVNNYLNSLTETEIKHLEHLNFSGAPRECDKLIDDKTRDIDVDDQLLSCVYSITDKPILSRARATLPESYLVIGSVKRETAIFAKKSIPKRTQFGPLEGMLIQGMHDIKVETNILNYFIELESDTYQMDVSDENHANWMCFVRKANTYDEQNLVVIQENDSLYFTTTMLISPKQELKVGYSSNYAQKFNLKYLKPTVTIVKDTWSCYGCTSTFSSMDNLKKHNCNEKFKPKITLKKILRHMKKPEISAFECKICKEVIYCDIDVSVLKNHLRIHRLDDWSSFDKHFTTLSTFKCDHCVTSFKSDALLKIHKWFHKADLLDDEQSNHNCPQCQRDFLTQELLVVHVFSHALPQIDLESEEKKVKCPVCYKVFADLDRLQSHLLVHGSEDEKPLECKTCHKRFLNNSALACHIKVHFAGKDVFECPICKESFDHVLKLKRHVPKHCCNNQFTCPHCKKVFWKYSIIRKHIRAFHCDQKHICEQCSKSFHTIDKLRMHLLTHSDHKEFLCADCGKQFRRKDKLKEHCQKMHSKEREKVVPVKQYTKCLSLSHQRSKFTPKVEPTDFHRFIYKCHTCLVGFKRRGMLVNHLAKRHPDIRPDSVPELNLPILLTTRDYYCQYCEKVYKSSSKRKAHILKNHPGAALPVSSRKQTALQEVTGMPNPTYSQTVGSVTTRPQNCDWCHKQYASKAKLIQHQRKKHPEHVKNYPQNLDDPQSDNIDQPPAVVQTKKEECPADLKQETKDTRRSIGNNVPAQQQSYAPSSADVKVADVVSLNDIISSEIDGYDDSQYCHLSINENDIMESANELENPNSPLYRLLTTNNGLLPPR